MKEKAIHLARAGEQVLFIYDTQLPEKTLLHYSLENYFKDALQNCSGSILVVNATSFVSYFIIISNHYENTEYSHMPQAMTIDMPFRVPIPILMDMQEDRCAPSHFAQYNYVLLENSFIEK